MTKDAYYFPHDSNAKDDPKIIDVIEELGLEGYGIYWVLIETLRDQPDYQAPVRLLRALARRYNTTEEKIKAVVSRYGLFDNDDESFWSPALSRRMSAIDARRKRRSEAGKKGAAARLRSESNSGKVQVKLPPSSAPAGPRSSLSPSQAGPQSDLSDTQARKEKERKEKKSKEKEIQKRDHDHAHRADAAGSINASHSEPVQVYLRELRQSSIHHYYADLINAARIEGDKLELWRAVCAEWLAAGYKPTNVVDLIGLYKRRVEDVVSIRKGTTARRGSPGGGGDGFLLTYNEMLAIMSKEGIPQTAFEIGGEDERGKKLWIRR